MITTIFSTADFRADFNPGTLSDLAGQGTHGVEVIVVAALSVIVCALLIFLYRFYREARKYDLLRDESIKELTETVQKYTAAADQRFEKIADSLDRLENDVTGGFKQLSEKVEDHEQRLGAIEGQIDEHTDTLDEHGLQIVDLEDSLTDKQSDAEDPAAKPAKAAKKPKRKSNKKK